MQREDGATPVNNSVNALLETIDRSLLSDDEQIELSHLSTVIDLGGDFTALSSSDFDRFKQILNKGRGKDVTPSA